MAAQDLPVLPLKAKSKVPATSHGKHDATTDPDQIAEWFQTNTDYNVGILTGDQPRLIVVDIDPRNDGEAGFERLERAFGKLPETRRVKTGGGGRHLYFKAPDGTVGLKDRPNVAGYRGVDLKADGYVVAPPSIHQSGMAYEWENDMPIAEAPDWLIGLARSGKLLRSVEAPSRASVLEGSRNDSLFRMACGLQARGLSPDAILAATIAENMARCVPPLEADEVERIVESATRYDSDNALPETDLGNARRLVALSGGDIRYESDSKRWYKWDGRHWERDDAGHVVRMAKHVTDVLLSAAMLVEDPDARKRRIATALKSQSANRIESMVKLASTEPGVPISYSEFDQGLHFLNVANGMVDLRTGELLPHNRDALSTKMIDIRYDPAATCPVFEKFISEVLTKDPELVEYLQRSFGYSATGETREQCFFLFHGEGANRKSTVQNAIRNVLGTYGMHTPTDTLIAKTGGISNDLARLAGARYVTASEANADQKLAEALLKQITGDEPMVARFLFKEFISFRPTFKLFLATNQLPLVNGNDVAIWRRIRTIPFNRVFREEEQDKNLANKLAAEQVGILAWIVRGAMKWYRDGLPVPAAVRSANEAYRTEMDSVGQFIDDQCEVAANANAPASTLFITYRSYCNHSGRVPVNQTVFGRALNTRGFRAEKRSGMVYRVGIKLRTTMGSE